MNLTAIQLAEKLEGTLQGDGKVQIHQLAKIEDAKSGSLTFLSNPKYTPFLFTTQASIVLISKDLELKDSVDCTLIRVDDPYAAFTNLLYDFAAKKQKNREGIDPSAIIHPTAQLAKGVFVGPFVSVGAYSVIEEGVQIDSHGFIGANVTIAKNTILYPRVSIMDDTEVGEHCIFHSGVIIGSDGFGFAPQKSGGYLKIPQIGKVVIKNRVEIGANTSIDRATLGETIIHEGVKLDNLVQIAHNVEIGAHTVIAAQSGVAGSSKVGSHCVIGGQVGIIGHLTIGNNVQIQGQTGVISNIPDGSKIQGTPSMDYKSFYKSYVLFKRLPELDSRMRDLEKNKEL
jgi:UDP-3-O-[3-hydroxymyristoyl] glucosamine N-acyltransferase